MLSKGVEMVSLSSGINVSVGADFWAAVGTAVLLTSDTGVKSGWLVLVIAAGDAAMPPDGLGVPVRIIRGSVDSWDGSACEHPEEIKSRRGTRTPAI
jgi:hypothetical protein